MDPNPGAGDGRLALRPAEPTDAELRRVADAALGAALDALGDPELDDSIRVHEVRKRCKTARAVARLARPGLGESFDATNRAVRDAAREFADLRDADVLVETVEVLTEGSDGNEPPVADEPDLSMGAVEALRAAAREHRTETWADVDLEGRADRCREGLLAAGEGVASWPTVGTGDVFDGLRASYRQGREGFADARAAPAVTVSEPDAGAEPRHEWRKRVKDHGTHLRLLRAAWPAVLDARTAECDRLAADLGTDHDLAVLIGTLAARVDGDGEVDAGALSATVARRRGALVARTDPLGRRIYADPPGAFADRFRTWWLAEHDY